METQQPRFRTIAELRRDWLLAFGKPPPPDLGRELLGRALAWKEQERLHGGLRAETVRHLRRLAQQLDRSGELDLERQVSLKAGTRLVREWNGRTIHVAVENGGFICDGQKYPSLSHVARAVTGTRWSGPRFFGLRQRSRGASADG
jgi:hypothetical protein